MKKCYVYNEKIGLKNNVHDKEKQKIRKEIDSDIQKSINLHEMCKAK